MIDSMQEQVAQALFDRGCERAMMRGQTPHHKPGTLVANMPASYRDDYMADALAIIEAMHEPTGAMIDKGAEAYSHGSDTAAPWGIRDAWCAMIDAALDEGVRGPLRPAGSADEFGVERAEE